jgi:hypothetical protein
MVMPVEMRGQNGIVLRKNTPIEAEGCPYALRVVHKTIHRNTLTLQIAVPQSGRLTANGNGIPTTTKTARGRSTLTLILKTHSTGHPRTKIQLRFIPNARKQRKVLHKSLTITLR